MISWRTCEKVEDHLWEGPSDFGAEILDGRSRKPRPLPNISIAMRTELKYIETSAGSGKFKKICGMRYLGR